MLWERGRGLVCGSESVNRLHFVFVSFRLYRKMGGLGVVVVGYGMGAMVARIICIAPHLRGVYSIPLTNGVVPVLCAMCVKGSRRQWRVSCGNDEM